MVGGGGMNEWEPVEDLAEIIVYGCTERTNMEATVARKLIAVNAYQQQWVGLSLPLQQFRIKAGRKKRSRKRVWRQRTRHG